MSLSPAIPVPSCPETDILEMPFGSAFEASLPAKRRKTIAAPGASCLSLETLTLPMGGDEISLSLSFREGFSRDTPSESEFMLTRQMLDVIFAEMPIGMEE